MLTMSGRRSLQAAKRLDAAVDELLRLQDQREVFGRTLEYIENIEEAWERVRLAHGDFKANAQRGGGVMTARDNIQFAGVSDALRWAINICARDGYVSPSITRMMGAARSTDNGMTLLEMHGQAAMLVRVVEVMPEPYQAAVWFRAGVLPWDAMRALAVYLVPHIVRQMPTGASNRRAVEMAILNTAGAKGASKSAISRELQVRNQDGVEWAQRIAEKLDAFARIAESEVDRVMREKGLILGND